MQLCARAIEDEKKQKEKNLEKQIKNAYIPIMNRSHNIDIKKEGTMREKKKRAT